MRFFKNMLYASIGFLILQLAFDMVFSGGTLVMGQAITRALIFSAAFAGYYEFTQRKKSGRGKDADKNK